MSAKEQRCYKHYCRVCHAMEFVPHVSGGKNDTYPRCHGKPMAYLGIVDAIPGRDETLNKSAALKQNLP